MIGPLSQLSYRTDAAFQPAEAQGSMTAPKASASGIFTAGNSSTTIDDLLSIELDFEAGRSGGSSTLNRIDGIEVLSDSSDDSDDSDGLAEVLRDLTSLGIESGVEP